MPQPLCTRGFVHRVAHAATLVELRLCGGHDSLLFCHSDGLATTLVTKDRVLAHNPVGALQPAETSYGRIWGPERPASLPLKPAEGRR